MKKHKEFTHPNLLIHIHWRPQSITPRRCKRTGTVFAYGQTSSGKTYTMQGSGVDPGVTRLAIRDVFTNIEKVSWRQIIIFFQQSI